MQLQIVIMNDGRKVIGGLGLGLAPTNVLTPITRSGESLLE